MTRKAWKVVVGIALCVALLGIGIALNIVRAEGWAGLWHRKKDFINDTQPGVGPVLDAAEKRVRGGLESKR